MANSNKSARISYLKDRAFQSAFQDTWMLPLWSSMWGIMQCLMFVPTEKLLLRQENVNSEVDFRFGLLPWYGITDKTKCDYYVPWLEEWVGAKDCSNALLVLSVILITKPLIVHLILRKMNRVYTSPSTYHLELNYQRQAWASSINTLFTFIIITHMETLAGHNHYFAAYVSLISGFHMLYFNSRWDTVLFVFCYMADCTSLIFGGSYKEWFLVSNLYIVSFLLFALLYCEIIYRNMSRRWDYTQALLVCLEKTKLLKAYPKALSESHHSSQVSQTVRSCLDRSETIMNRNKSNSLESSEGLGGENLQRTTSDSRLFSDVDIGLGILRPDPSHSPERVPDPENVVQPPSSDDDKVKSTGNLNWLDSFISILKDSFISESVKMQVMIPYEDVAQKYLPVLIDKGTTTTDGASHAKPFANSHTPSFVHMDNQKANKDHRLGGGTEKTEGTTVTYSNLKSKTSVCIAVNILRSTGSTTATSESEENIHYVIEMLAVAHKITYIRYFGDTWIGNLGIYNSFGSLAKDSLRAVEFCCAIQHVLKTSRYYAGCTICNGDMICGFMGQQVLDIFGTPVQRALDNNSQISNKYLDCGVYFTEASYTLIVDFQKSSLLSKNNNDRPSQKASHSIGGLYHTESTSDNSNNIPHDDDISLEDTSKKHTLQNPHHIILGNSDDGLGDWSLSENATLHNHLLDDFRGVIYENIYRGNDQPNLVAEIEPKCAETTFFVVKNDVQMSLLDSKCLIYYRNLTQIGPHNERKNFKYLEEDHFIPDAEFEAMIYGQGTGNQKQNRFDGEHKWEDKYEERSELHVPEHLRTRDVLPVFFQSPYANQGFSVYDPILMDVYNNEELVLMHATTTNSIEALLFKKCYNSNSIRRFFGLETYASDFVTSIDTKTTRSKVNLVNGVPLGKPQILVDVTAHPSLAPQSAFNICSDFTSTFTKPSSTIRPKYSSIFFTSDDELNAKSNITYDKYQSASTATIFHFFTQIGSYHIIYFFNLLVNVTFTLFSWIRLVFEKGYFLLFPDQLRQYTQVSEDSSSTSEKGKIDSNTVEVISVEKVGSNSAKTFYSKYNYDCRVLSTNRMIDHLLFFAFQIVPLITMSSRTYTLDAELSKRNDFGTQETFTSTLIGHIVAQLLMETRYKNFLLLVSICCRLVQILKFPVAAFKFGFHLSEKYYYWSFPFQSDLGGNTGVALMFCIFQFPALVVLFSQKQLLVEFVILISAFYYRAIIYEIDKKEFFSFAARMAIVASFFANIIIVVVLHKIIHCTFVIETKMLPYANAVNRKYKTKFLALRKLYFPAAFDQISPLRNMFQHNMYKDCIVIAIKIRSADLLPAYIGPAIFGQFMGNVFAVVDEAIHTCGLVKISTCNGLILAVCTQKTSLFVALSQVLTFLDQIGKKMQQLMIDNDCSIVWSVGLDVGNISIGMASRTHTQFDLVGRARDYAVMFTKLDEQKSATFLSNKFDSLAIKYNVYHTDVSRISRNIIIDGQEMRVIKIETNYIHNGMTLNDLQPLRLIGKGGFGHVILVKERDTHLLYAVKVIRRKSPAIDKKVQTEFLYLRELSHINIVGFKYCLTGKTKVYLVMNYIRGGNLSHVVETYRPPLIYLISFFAELILALEYIHSRGVVHCDVKPLNCLVGTNGHLVLSDFGLSKVITDNIFFNYSSSSAKNLISKILPLKRSVAPFAYTVLIISAGTSYSKTELNQLAYKTFTVSTPQEFMDFILQIGTPDMILLELQNFIEPLENNCKQTGLDTINSTNNVNSPTQIGRKVGNNSDSNFATSNFFFNQKGKSDVSYDKFSTTNIAEEVKEGVPTIPVLKEEEGTGARSLLKETHGKLKEAEVDASTLSMEGIFLSRCSNTPFIVCTAYSDLGVKSYYESFPYVRAVLPLPFSTQVEHVDLIATLALEGRKNIMRDINFYQTSKYANENVIGSSLSNSFSDDKIFDSSILSASASAQSASTGLHTGFSAAALDKNTHKKSATEKSAAESTTEQQFERRRVVGTLQYLAPETIRSRHYGRAGDWWACGVTMYECTCNSRLFVGHSKDDILRKILSSRTDLSLMSTLSFQQLAECDAKHKSRSCLTEMPSVLPPSSVPNSDDKTPPVQAFVVSKIEHLLSSMLKLKKSGRLGTSGAADIKAHPFFDSINFETVSIADPEWKPSQYLGLKYSTDTKGGMGHEGQVHKFDPSNSRAKDSTLDHLFYDTDYFPMSTKSSRKVGRKSSNKSPSPKNVASNLADQWIQSVVEANEDDELQEGEDEENEEDEDGQSDAITGMSITDGYYTSLE